MWPKYEVIAIPPNVIKYDRSIWNGVEANVTISQKYNGLLTLEESREGR